MGALVWAAILAYLYILVCPNRDQEILRDPQIISLGSILDATLKRLYFQASPHLPSCEKTWWQYPIVRESTVGCPMTAHHLHQPSPSSTRPKQHRSNPSRPKKWHAWSNKLRERDVTVALHLQELTHVLKPRREQSFGPIRHSIHRGPAEPKLARESGLGRELCATWTRLF